MVTVIVIAMVIVIAIVIAIVTAIVMATVIAIARAMPTTASSEKCESPLPSHLATSPLSLSNLE